MQADGPYMADQATIYGLSAAKIMLEQIGEKVRSEENVQKVVGICLVRCEHINIRPSKAHEIYP